ncbi:hypothetical protein BDN72DRAFT_907378 [Pluteus cervinus]|uniref:Uncharacterized protein n=1 Tax=Pluteus cervinus TaxID=181527 RepID=A0ACD2ZX43_9AGAR|nr:hypothetical protein BDN72DRAFT_907378 [Pluteus cervinus]
MGQSSTFSQQSLVPLISFTLGNLSPIKKLTIALRYCRIPEEIAIPKDMPEWLNPAPHLVDLYLGGLDLPANLFSGTTPRLQSLDLSWCMVVWETLPIIPGLRHLSISSTNPASVDKILKIFHVIGPDPEELVAGH